MKPQTNPTPTDSGFDVPPELGSDKATSDHTPGDWRYDTGNTNYEKPSFDIHAHGQNGNIGVWIATVHCFQVDCGEANAALIASAPHLLRENQALLSICERLASNKSGERIVYNNIRHDAMQVLRGLATSTPKPPSDAATGTPAGEE